MGKLDIVVARKIIFPEIMFGNEQTTYNQWLVIITPFTVATAECGPPTVCPAKIILSGDKDMGCCMKLQVLCPRSSGGPTRPRACPSGALLTLPLFRLPIIFLQLMFKPSSFALSPFHVPQTPKQYCRLTHHGRK